MDLQKTKIYLDKLNREFTRLSRDPDNIARIDIDIMASYVRELYDAMLSESTFSAAKSTPVAASKPAPRPIEVVEAPTPAPAAPPPPPVIAAPPPAVVIQPAPAVVVPPPAPVVVETPPPAPAPVVEAPPVAPPSPAAAPVNADVLFEEKQAKELSEKLSELPIADLKKAIALNDRLLLTRELFSGDGQVFESTISALNGFTQFSAAQQYLLDHCVVRYGWLDKKRMDAAKDFIKLVRRRYK